MVARSDSPVWLFLSAVAEVLSTLADCAKLPEYRVSVGRWDEEVVTLVWRNQDRADLVHSARFEHHYLPRCFVVTIESTWIKHDGQMMRHHEKVEQIPTDTVSVTNAFHHAVASAYIPPPSPG